MRNDLQLVRRLIGRARPYTSRLAIIFFIELLATPIALLTPVPLMIAVDSVLGDEPVPGFLRLVTPEAWHSSPGLLVLVAFLVVIIALLNQLQGYGGWFVKDWVGEQMDLGERANLFHHVQRLSLAHHDAKGSSDAVFRLEHDASALRHFLLTGAIPLISHVFTLVAMIYITLRLDWIVALVALSVSPLLFAATQYFLPRMRSQWAEVKNIRSAAMGIAQEVLGALRVVKAFGQEGRENHRYVEQQRIGVAAYLNAVGYEVVFGSLIGLGVATGTAAALYLGVRHVQTGLLTLGELLLIMSYLAQLYGPLRSIGARIASLQVHLVGAERVLELLDLAPDGATSIGDMRVERTLGDIAFQHVSFSYPTGPAVLHDVTFHVPAGTRVGVVGHTGAGKSTLVNLMVRFHEASSGDILLDGSDIRSYNLEDVRRQFAIVLQDPVLFSTTIGDNIAYGQPGATHADVRSAALAAGAHEFITRLEKGYSTAVGERGITLSGGERQRIALARAFLRDAPILILDEPTSSIDLRTEASIMQTMELLMHGRTVFMIAHRLDTLTKCDLILRFAHGRLVETSWDPESILGAIRNDTESPLESSQ